MKGSKVSKKRIKSDHLLGVVANYKFLFLGVLCHIFILLAFAFSAEFHDMIGARYEAFIDVMAIVGVILLIISRVTRWSYPMSFEECLIILLLWVILSGRISHTHCFCCGGHRAHSTALIEDSVEMVAVGIERRRDDDDFMLEVWQLFVKECHPESFNFVYSLLCVVLVAASFFTELRNYYVSLLFRLSTVCLIALVGLLLVVSPSLCSKFSIHESFVTLMRITLFEILWFCNVMKRLTERVLVLHYSEALAMTTERLSTLTQPHTFTTPRSLFLELGRLCKQLAQLYGEAPVKKSRHRPLLAEKEPVYKERHTLLLPLNAGEENGGEEGGEEDVYPERVSVAKPRREKKAVRKADQGETAVEETLTDIVCQLATLSQRHKETYLGSAMSWKNRGYGENLLHIIDLAHTVWLLIVCPLWLVLAPLEILWLLYYIYQNTRETRETYKLLRLLDVFLASDEEAFAIGVT
jgi:hypothetical protein